MDKYEISLWEEFPDTTSDGKPFLNERKLCVIGSDTMHGMMRAIEPKMVNNVNGTNTFTFKMYQVYIDEFTGEKILNPFLNLLINERKVKVFWKDKWYDLLIKNLSEDTSNKTVTYTCKDSYITELSRNGYNLEYSIDLQNNTGTASELAESVLKNSGWKFDASNSTKIIQHTEEPVYEINTTRSFSATKQSPNGDTTVNIPQGAKVLVFYSSVVDVTNTNLIPGKMQFLYAAEGYATDENDMLVLNGDCYEVSSGSVKRNGDYVQYYIGNNVVLNINTVTGISTQYRAERLVKSQITEYDPLFDRYVNVYTDNTTNKKVYGYERTEFSDPLMVVNLVANPSAFTSLDGWIGNELSWGMYPKFTRNTSITGYNAKSYLKLTAGYTYNSAISSNQQYLTPSQGDIKNGNTGGFHVGDKYIFRVKVHPNSNNAPVINTYEHGNVVRPFIGKYNDNYQPINTSNNYFSVGGYTSNGSWTEFVLTCQTACPAEEITTLGLFVYATAIRWIEEIEFFKYEVGLRSYDSTAEERINPGEVALQSVAKTVYRYYNADHNGVDNVEELTFLYEGENKQENRFIPQTNNYEKITTIEARASNRFNILQSIAENFECWVRFNIDHDETGRVTFDEDGLPNKTVTLVDYIGTDLGWSFEYGIDLRTIRRTIISDNLTTKVLVLPNDNEFGKNGFCTIARSNLNYTKENFILDFGYYINQGLLDQRTVDRDLYSSSNDWIGYYYFLHAYNKEYDEITDILVQKRTELTKQQSQLIVLEQQQKASQEQLGNVQSDLITLACVDSWVAAQSYAQAHADHTKVQSLMNNVARLQNTITKNASQLNSLRASVTKLESYINEKAERQQALADAVEDLHTRFFKKYARYIQEGTWQDNSYIDDDKYYLDGVDVAYTSSRPQLQYDINVMRLMSLEDFSSKKFGVGDICYIVDRDFFGYAADGITPYKLKIVISEITSNFDNPEKDTIKVQNYKTQFDDLFQRITATTQSLQYASGGYEKAAAAIKPDKTLSFDLLQDTFDYNENWVLNASNQQVTWDSTGITVTDDANAALKLKIMAGGVFISNDGGVTWKNAVRGDGISTDVLTAGRINTSEIFVYDGNHPSFRWDSAGIDAYYFDDLTSNPTFSKFVRFDRFGLYGFQGSSDFAPSTEDAIWDPESGVKFGLTWRGFFLRGENGGSSLEISDDGDGIVFLMRNAMGKNSLEISTMNDIVLKTLKDGSTTQTVDRVQIGRLNPEASNTEYGIWVRDGGGDNIFNVSSAGTNSIGGWNLTKDSFYHTDGTSTIGLYSAGKSATVQGTTKTFHILAGNKFGVTVDGEIYSSGGKIGGWTINDSTLTGGNITIDSAGNMSCTVNGVLKWKLDNDGLGTFHNIFADIGYIAGWHIEPESIWNDSGTSLNSNLEGSYNIDRYTIVTDSIKATGGSIGGCTVSDGSISGGNWSLTGTGGTIGGWQITATSIKGTNIELFSSGSIDINGISLTGRQGGGLTIGGDVYLVGNTLTAYAINSTTGYTTFDGDTSSTLAYSQFNYLHWLQDNWGKTTPEQVRAEGRNQVINGATGGIAYDGDDYIWSWASYNGTTFASAHKYIDTPSTTGSVYLDYDYDDDGDWTGYVRARCTQCGSTGWHYVG